MRQFFVIDVLLSIFQVGKMLKQVQHDRKVVRIVRKVKVGFNLFFTTYSSEANRGVKNELNPTFTQIHPF